MMEYDVTNTVRWELKSGWRSGTELSNSTGLSGERVRTELRILDALNELDTSLRYNRRGAPTRLYRLRQFPNEHRTSGAGLGIAKGA